MSELELRLDEAIDGCSLDVDVDIVELVELAHAVRALPADEWPDHAFPHRLAEALADALRPQQKRTPRRHTLPRLRVGLALAAAVALAVALAVTLGRSPSSSAAALAREALAATSGRSLAPVTFTQVITNTVPRGRFEPLPPPARVVEHVTFASPTRWRIEATVTEPNGEGTATTLTVRNGDTIVTVTHSPAEGTTETRRHATGAGLPNGTIDLPTLLRQAHGRCARKLAPLRAGPVVAGRATEVLALGANPCPSADLADLDGPATLVVDRQTHLVLEATVRSASGQVTQRVRTRALAAGTAPAKSFRLPKPLPAPHVAGGKMAFTALLPRTLPSGLRAGAIVPTSTQASTGKTLAFTITYTDAGGHAQLQLYEAKASVPSVRFPGRRVQIRPGLSGTYMNRNGFQTLWWIEHGTYMSLQQGGMAGGTKLEGKLPLASLLSIAATAA